VKARCMACFAALLAAWMLLPASAFAEAILDVQKELKILERGEKLPLRIPNARIRVASFTYEDPDRTELGDSLALLVGRQVLVKFLSSSIGVLNYEGSLAPAEGDRLSYFDKVERIAEAQQVTLSIWGMVRRSGANLTINTYVQLPPAVIERNFAWRVELPSSMRGELVGHLRPDRILVQQLEVPMNAARKFREAATALKTMRSDPSDSARVVGTLPRESVYWIEKNQGDWLFFNTGSSLSGWVRQTGACMEECAQLLDSGDFAALLLATAASPGARKMQGTSLSAEAQVVGDQIRAYELLDRGEPDEVASALAQIGNKLNEARRSGTVPPGGAALANAWTVATLATQMKTEARQLGRDKGRLYDPRQGYDQLKPDREQIRRMAFDLAEVSLSDPNNVDVLHNLSILFAYAGEQKRADLAKSLAAERAR
jgi:hypothetical protein